MTEAMEIFDRVALRQRRDRAAGRQGDHDFLVREAAERLVERLEDVKRRFPFALDLGCREGCIGDRLHGRGGIQTLIQCDLSEAYARKAAAKGRPSLVGDEEALPFARHSFDLVLSSFALHWVNDLPGTLAQLAQTLKPDGLLLVSLLGGETLRELRACLAEAESELRGGLSPRVSPFADTAELGGLLQRAGLALPVADRDRLTVTYPNALALMHDLQAMGEANLLRARSRSMTGRGLLLRAAALYEERFAGPDGRLPATFELITLTAWAPHQSQPKALRPGAAARRLAEALETEEIPAGDKARPAGPGDTGRD